jgi:hypothetical protein
MSNKHKGTPFHAIIRTRTAIIFMMAAIAITASGIATSRRSQGVAAGRTVQLDGDQPVDHLLLSRQRGGTLPRSGYLVRPHPPMVTAGLVSPPLGEPFEVPIPPFTDKYSWAFFPAIGDLDGDGQFDLMVGSRLGQMRVHRGKGAGFAPPVWFHELCPDGRIPTG